MLIILETVSELIIAPLQYQFMQRALIGAILIGATCGVLGAILILRGLALLGEAISHAVLPGVAISYLLQISYFWGALVAGLLTTTGIFWIEKNSKLKDDTAIGIMFTAAFALGVLIISKLRTHIDLFHILFGNILGIASTDLIFIAIVAVVIICLIILFYQEFNISTFDPTLAKNFGLSNQLIHYSLIISLTLTVVISLQAVGIILVVALLITPAATAYLLVNDLKEMIFLAAIIAVISSVAGLYISFYLNLASGAAIVLVLSLIFAIVFLKEEFGVKIATKLLE